MWDTPLLSAGPSRWLFPSWVAFSALCVLSMYVTPRYGAVGFHFVWISLALVYGVQGRDSRRTAVVLGAVVVVTTYAMADWVQATTSEWPELSEVPLMSAVFLTMVWHVHRRAPPAGAT